MREQLGKERGVVKDDAVGDQSAALRTEVLLVFGPKAQLSIVGIGDRATQLVIAFPTVYKELGIDPETVRRLRRFQNQANI